ncbi:hypothetical protein JKP88DRAFT_353729 [Tribonema minus]|uniref:F-box domain-containing protein n=1 Tax=Tribonema minus TaxID=303371 RepID=A0A835Z6C5_9STRA|nr:hypothetical protein JKP88DRAFT_353729 [Tribonema minus]
MATEASRQAFQGFLPVDLLEQVITFLDPRSLHDLLSLSTTYRQLSVAHIWRQFVLDNMKGLHNLDAIAVDDRDWEQQLWTWTYSAFTWRRVACGGTGDPGPEPRYLHRMAVDDDNVAWLFGGWGEPVLLNDLWKLDLTKPALRWEQVDAGAAHGDGGGGGHGGSGGELGFAIPQQAGAAAPAVAADNAVDGVPEADGAAGDDALMGDYEAAAAAEAVAAPQQQQQAAAVVAADAARPAARCAASWTHMPGTRHAYLFGGMGEDGEFYADLWRFDMRRGAWEERPVVAARKGARASDGVVRCWDDARRRDAREAVSDAVRLNVVAAWTRLEALRVPSVLASLITTVPEARRIEQCLPLPQSGAQVPGSRWGHTAVALDGTLYVYGGSMPGECFAELWAMTPGTDADTGAAAVRWTLLALWAMTPATDADTGAPAARWTLLAVPGDAPPRRGGHSATLLGGHMYVFGGNTVQTCYNDLWRIALPAARRWEALAVRAPCPEKRIGHQAVAIGRKLFIFGGRSFSTNQFAKDASCYDVDEGRFVAAGEGWRQAGGCRTGHAAILCDRGMLVFGGLLEPMAAPPRAGLLLLDMSGQAHRRRRGAAAAEDADSGTGCKSGNADGAPGMSVAGEGSCC